jgi:hypothetical protein
MGPGRSRSTTRPSTDCRYPPRCAGRAEHHRLSDPDRPISDEKESAPCRSSPRARPVPGWRGAGQSASGSRSSLRAPARRTRPHPSRRCASRSTRVVLRAARVGPGGRHPRDPSCADGSAASGCHRSVGTDACRAYRRSGPSAHEAARANGVLDCVDGARGFPLEHAPPARRGWRLLRGRSCRPQTPPVTIAESRRRPARARLAQPGRRSSSAHS